MSLCKCSTSTSNTGYDCGDEASYTVKSFLFNRKKADGTLSGIDLTSDLVDGVIPSSFITNKINDSNKEDRWYPIGDFESIDDVRAEHIMETFPSGNSSEIDEGMRKFNGKIPSLPASYLGRLKSFACNPDLAIIHVDRNGNAVGESIDGNFLRGMPIAKGSFIAMYTKKTYSESSSISVSFNYSKCFKDENMFFIKSDIFESDLIKEKGLFDVKMTGTATTTAATINAKVIYGNSISESIFMKSLVANDFGGNIRNLTQSADVTIDSVSVDNADTGDYILNYTGVTSADAIKISASKEGFDIQDLTITTS